MPVRTKLPAIVIVASSCVLPLAAPDTAAAQACLTAPKGQAPEGSHWYYRIERPSLRKCWRLVSKGEESGAARAASRSAQPARQAQKPAEEIVAQGDVEDESEAAPAPPASRPAVAQAKPAPAPINLAQAPVIDNGATRNAPVASEAPLPLPPPAPSADATQRAEAPSAPWPVAQPAQAENAPLAVTEQPAAQPRAAGGKGTKTSASDGTPMLSWLPAVLALLGLAGGAVFYLTRARRRRSDVLTIVQDTHTDPIDAPEASLAPDEATFAPLPPIGAQSREDDVDEALRRFAENWKRRAA